MENQWKTNGKSKRRDEKMGVQETGLSCGQSVRSQEEAKQESKTEPPQQEEEEELLGSWLP